MRVYVLCYIRIFSFLFPFSDVVSDVGVNVRRASNTCVAAAVRAYGDCDTVCTTAAVQRAKACKACRVSL